MAQPTILRNFRQKLMQPVDASSLACFRILFGLTMACYVFQWIPPDAVQKKFIHPQFFFSFALFDILHLKPWPAYGMYLHFLVMGIAAIFIALGLFYRFALAVFFMTFGYFFLLEKSYYNNHYYLILLMTFLFFLMGAHRCTSIDAARNPKLHTQQVPYWNIFLFRMQICFVYFYGGVTKLNMDWLQGKQVGIWLGQRTHYPVLGPYFDQEWLVLFFCYAGLFFDLTIGFLLWHRRWRWVAFFFVMFFHLMNKWLFNIMVFHNLMLATIVLFVDPHHPRWLFNKIRERWQLPAVASPRGEGPARENKRFSKVVLSFIAVYLLIQTIVPLRHLLYPGDVNWTHEGQRFAWRFVANHVNVNIRFFGTNPATGQTIEANLPSTLSTTQMIEVASRPDMIIQYAHYFRDQLKGQGIPNPVVTVKALVGLNGRPPAPLIDENVNLADKEYPRPFQHADWVLPHPDQR